MLEKLSKDLERETKRREAAVKEKEISLETLSAYTEIYNALNIADPQQFMASYEELRSTVTLMTDKIDSMTDELLNKESQFKLQEE